MPPEDDSALARLQNRLNKPGTEAQFSRSRLPTRSSEIPRAWKQEPPPPLSMPRPKKKLPLSVKFFIGAIVFFVVAGAAAAYLLFVGGNAVSTNNITISVTGPTTAAGGDTVPLLITVENHNPVALTSTSLTAAFPDGTRSADDVTQSFTQYDDAVGTLAAGQAITQTVRFVPFGAENQVITIPIKVEYKTPNSNAIFVKEQDYAITLTTSPVSIAATSVSQISSGQPLTISVSVRSNASKPLSNIALLAQYPFGFAVGSTSLPSDNGLFTIGTLQPGQEQKLTVTGVLSGSDNDERVFHWSVGSTASSTNGSLGVVYTATESDVTITQPFLNVSLSLNGSSTGSPTVSAGEPIQGIVRWTNTLATPVLNGQITIRLSGSGFDPGSVTASNGFYQSSNQTITFDSSMNSGLATLQPGDTGTGAFAFTIKSASALAALQAPSVTLAVSASGRRVGESGVPETLSSTLSSTLKITSGLSLSSHLVKTTGPFANSGPWPPAPGTATTYTVLLAAHNGTNAVGGATVRMTLPSYVTFTGLTAPADGSITYSDSNRAVTWVAGDMAGGGSTQAAFQISFLPSTSQAQSSPMLVSSETLTATDRFTQTTVSATAPSLDTAATSDPGYQNGDGLVQ